MHYTPLKGSCSVVRSCPNFCDPMDHSKPGFPVLHYLPEFAQAHVHWVSDAIQPTHPLSIFPSIFSSVSALHIRWPSIRASALASVLPMNIQGWFPLGLAGLILLSMGLSRVFSIATIQKHQNISYSLFPFNKWEWRSHLSCWVTQLGSCSGRRKSLGT